LHFQNQTLLCLLIFNFSQFFGHFTTHHQTLPHSYWTEKCASMNNFMPMTEHKNHILIIHQKVHERNYSYPNIWSHAKSKMLIQLWLFYNQQCLTLYGRLVVSLCSVMGLSTLGILAFKNWHAKERNGCNLHS